jgi:hypothetical protein
VGERGVALSGPDGERVGEPRAEHLVADGLDGAADVDQRAAGVRATHQRTVGGGGVAAVFHGSSYSALRTPAHITMTGQNQVVTPSVSVSCELALGVNARVIASVATAPRKYVGPSDAS